MSYSKGFGLLPETTPCPCRGRGFPPKSEALKYCRRLFCCGFCRVTTKIHSYMEEKENAKWGRHPKESRKTHCVMVRFDNEEWVRFLTMYEQSGVYAKAVFVKARVFGDTFKVLKVDKSLLDYYTKLSAFHAQFRAVGNNYNQTVKELKSHFSEKKAMALLYKLEKQTVELVSLSRQIIQLTQTFEERWSQKSV